MRDKTAMRYGSLLLLLLFAPLNDSSNLTKAEEWARVRVGLLPSWAAKDEAVVELVTKRAFQELREQGLLPANLHIEVLVRQACGGGSVSAAIAELVKEEEVWAVLGAACTSGVEAGGLLAAHWDLPLVSSLARGVRIADKAKYATTARVAETTKPIGQSLVEFLVENGWTEVGWVGDMWQSEANMLHDSLRSAFRSGRPVRVNVEADLRIGASLGEASDERIDEALRRVRDKARVIVLAFDSPYIGLGVRAARRILERAELLDMTGPDYVYVVPIGLATVITPQTLYTLPQLFDNATEGRMAQTFLHIPEGRADSTLQEALGKLERWTNGSGIFEGSPDWHVMMATLSYDAAYLYGLALGECLGTPDCSARSGRDLVARMRGRQFDGLSGRVVMSAAADREVSYRVHGLDPRTRRQKLYWRQDFGQGAERRTEAVVAFPWRTADGTPPPARPPCGFTGADCPSDSWAELSLALALLALALALVVGALKWHKHRLLESAILARDWEIPHSSMQNHSSKANTSLRHSVSSIRSKASGLSGAEPVVSVGGEVMGMSGRVRLEGRKVAVKRYGTKGQVGLRAREELLALKELREVRCEHLTAFLGLCLDAPEGLLAVWELCPKGSLADVLANEEIRLDAAFRSSMALDVASGLDFLHRSPVRAHGQLTADNCLVDARWTIKLTDFGIAEALRSARSRGLVVLKDFSAEKLLHTAPEVLQSWRAGLGLTVAPTTEGDVFAFAMVLYQILTRRSLLDEFQLSADELRAVVASGRLIKERPVVPAQLLEGLGKESRALIVPLMKSCWEEAPKDRPSSARVLRLLARLSSNGRSLIEHMMQRMENYAVDLERMVKVRTKEATEERQRAEELLGRMLPPSVAGELKAGRPVPPESFHSASIYFSDIVGFTALASQSSPLEVVHLLNYLYGVFDELIARFDAYKVETIGDAYMVASGLPRRNGERHAGELARMALAIRDAVAGLRPPHLPNRTLEIRAGLHSGPVAAGVVGRTMPRYCVFGDSVNVASRMESTGLPMRIQVTESTKTLLEVEGGFRLSFRDSVQVKGKGRLSTFWLEGLATDSHSPTDTPTNP